jgi:Phage integrase family
MNHLRRPEKLAEQFEHLEQADRLRGDWIDPRLSSVRFREVAEDWFLSNPGKKASSLTRDRSTLDVHVLPALGDCSVGQISQTDVQRLVWTWSSTLAPRRWRPQVAESPLHHRRYWISWPITSAVEDSLPPVPIATCLLPQTATPLHYSNWRQRVWTPALMKAGLVGLTFHALRRANATAMVSLSIDIKTAQLRVGHMRSSTLLDIYAQATTARYRRAADELGRHFLSSAATPELPGRASIQGFGKGFGASSAG